ncbi:Armadillo repeat-containing protein 3 and Serine/threonine-protein kinase CTR1 [Artemisia annua]|uniref:Armadillo repeat-containing protein 3 and Serine/threonine-protein kinase CTR1 n=1 Tax=Artemisia annua TaxID=35608 RepID=A0A2U1MU05_ARTAN|nr:Armadillo repeat-containing protein 3 and Serine/threonine-protein kinase CTR1 [Artemisia annua]
MFMVGAIVQTHEKNVFTNYQAEKMMHNLPLYIPLSRMNSDTSPHVDYSFPSLSNCKEIKEGGSTTFIQYNLGSVEADPKGKDGYLGHQISTKWLPSQDGTLGHRVLQSAIYMEHVKGNYIEKLGRSGSKHVPMGLALQIARDVAWALSEIHSKDIVHYDLKSENVLIDISEVMEKLL